MELSREQVYDIYWRPLLEGGIELLQKSYLDTVELKMETTDGALTVVFIHPIYVDLSQMIQLFEALVDKKFRAITKSTLNSISVWKLQLSFYQGDIWVGRLNYDPFSWLFQDQEGSTWRFWVEFLVRYRGTPDWKPAALVGEVRPEKSMDVYAVSSRRYLPVPPDRIKLDPAYQNTPLQGLLTSGELSLLDIDPTYTGPRHNRHLLFHIPYITGHWNDYEYTWALNLRVL